MGFIENQGLRYYQFGLFREQPVFHAVLTRQGGISQPPFDRLNTGGTVGDDPQAVLKNHHLIFDTLGIDYASRFDVWQVHGTDIICSEEPRPQDAPHVKADGILTHNPNVTLFMRFADCVPILLFDPIKIVIGILHAGWQGTYKKIAQAGIEKMSSCYGSDPRTILAAIGPSICQSCYEVGEEVYREFTESFGDKAGRYFEKRNGSLFLDMWKANADVLKTAGVTQIETAGICTACHLEDWFSHRAEQQKTGRFGVLLQIRHN